MELYILQLAIAKYWDETIFLEDSLSPLSEDGKKKMVKNSDDLRTLDVQIDMILSSPYKRAWEAARIMVKILELRSTQLVLWDQLSPFGFAKELIAKINESYWGENLMLVGHEPYLNNLVAMLVTGDPSMSIILRKGGICRLSIDNLAFDKCATLEWLTMPATMIG